jgi:SAM-dependent methyltransferase
MDFDVLDYNRSAWDRQVEQGNRWTVPVTATEIDAAREGVWEILLTPTLPVPRSWFPDLTGADVLCLASGGGQQGPILAAAGARVTVLDSSPNQLAQDRAVASRHGLNLTTVEGDMGELAPLADSSFDLVFHPASNMFVADVGPVWHECYRVLRASGVLLAGFANPVIYMVATDQERGQGHLRIIHSIPYSDLESLTPEERQRYAAEGEPLEFGHSLEQLIGGQLTAGFILTGFFEDSRAESEYPLASYTNTFIATRAIKSEARSSRASCPSSGVSR